MKTDQEIKREMIEEMLNDVAYGEILKFVSISLLEEYCDDLIRKGWRKVTNA